MIELIVCALCQKTRSRATVRMWGPSGSTMEAVPWCRSCEHKSTRHKGRAAAFAAFLMREWDGQTTRVCTGCKDEHPDVLFPYTLSSGGRVIVRRKRCIGCRAGECRRAMGAARALSGAGSAFDVTNAWITQSTGRAIEQWTADEHHAQCVLMREMRNIPHHVSALQPGPVTTLDTSRQERLWRTRLQAIVTKYVPSASDWQTWHVG